jgi:spectinomycin phosphotransferase
MREPLKLAEHAIVAALQAHYAISINALTFLPIGADSASAAYRVEVGGGADLFLKVRAVEGFSVPSLAIPHALHSQGIPHILAPLSTVTGTLWVGVDGFALSLYPFIEGHMGADVGLFGQQWRAFGTTVRQIHTDQLTLDLLQILRGETFVPSRRDVLTNLEAAIAEGDLAGSVQRELAAFWRSRQEQIRTLVARADALGRQLRKASLPHVLCHADLHTWNVLLDGEQEMWIVDWDETVLAPKERDLMFIVGGIGRDLVSPHETMCFLQGYGDAAIDPQALAYYRYAWAAQDIAAYGERAIFTPDLHEESRRDALRGLVGMFESGNIVDIALASDSIAP